MATRAVPPVWRMTPTNTIFRNQALPTANPSLEYARWRFASTIKLVDIGHPLALSLQPKIARARGFCGSQRPKTNLQTAACLLPLPMSTELLPPRYDKGAAVADPAKGNDKKHAAEVFKDWLRTLPPEEIKVYSDGSKINDEQVGYGFAIYQDDCNLFEGKGRLDPVSEFYDAEAVGAWMGLQRALQLPAAHMRKIWVFLDNVLVIQRLNGDPSPSSQWAFVNFQGATERFNIEVKWCPGHCGIEGNKRADRLAKGGAILPEAQAVNGPTVYGIKAKAKASHRLVVKR